MVHTPAAALLPPAQQLQKHEPCLQHVIAASVQVLQRRGCDVAFVGGSSSVIAAAGLGGRGVNVGIWDTLAPPQSACSGTLPFHQVHTAALAPTIWLCLAALWFPFKPKSNHSTSWALQLTAGANEGPTWM
jgi:hypothetical protein